ncbi:OB-fold domain-containing protein [Streptomyces sp. ASQP_92]|uniref:bifunctional MaoC family dehydratase N-terminal/OB-fold nucleic acid binding domain-containing protein n=1 Tax=Streptomyces sp. ASQP_92 TaxID=2979116 RepID=UPI0021BEA526|nr:bifunctional MaoC family dehydratase N-terminal/OB-fold nucleic acid binding domain-containing protein [Streptomyces sp. ASQP_92]MCT9090477.1 OB-fold domain-containing protein [Streptomyces sp. ASQP_92]
MEKVEEAEFAGRLKKFEGRPAATGGVGKDLVNAPMIRHWCEAMGDTHPAYTGPDAIAPPTMLQAWTMGGLSGHGDGTGRATGYDELFELLDGAGFTSVVATDCEQEYLRDLRPGDRVTYDAVIETVSERKTTKLGTGHFVTTRMDVHANGVLAGMHRFRILKYAPAQASSDAADIVRVGSSSQGQPSSSRGRAAPEPGAGGTAARVLRPRPVVNRDNAGFWAGVAEHRLLIQRCDDCAELRFPWLPGCHACGSGRWDTVEASGDGRVYSYVVMHHPPFPAFDPPYAVGLIELAEGVRIISNVVGVAPDAVRIGMPVRLEFLRADHELELPVFRAEAA